MYLRPHKTTKNGSVYEYWSLVKSVRTARGPRQKIVASIGKLPGLDQRTRMGWEHIGAALEGRIPQADLFEDRDLERPQWASVDVSRVRVERLRDFGDVYLGLALWRRLRLDQFFHQQMGAGREQIAWDLMACILTLARFCAPSSELKIAEHWSGNPQAKRGHSRDQRSDCVQLCIGLIVTPEGLPVAYEVFDGNRTDVTTVEEVIEALRLKYGHERRIWVMDRGMVSEEHLEQLREWSALYLVGTPNRCHAVKCLEYRRLLWSERPQ